MRRLLGRGDALVSEQLDLFIDGRSRTNEATGRTNLGILRRRPDALGRWRHYDMAIAVTAKRTELSKRAAHRVADVSTIPAGRRVSLRLA